MLTGLTLLSYAPAMTAPASRPDLDASEPATLEARVRAESAARRERERRGTRRAILDAAIELFDAAGRDNVSMRQVAAAVGYSATTIYNYFEDKDDLLHHVVLDGFTEFGRRLQDAYDAGADPVDRCRRLGTAYVSFALDYPFHYRLMFMERAEFLGRPAPEGYERPIDSFGVLRRVVDECVEVGAFPERDRQALSMEVWCQVHGVASMAIATRYLPRGEALAFQRRMGATLLRGFAAEAEARAPG